MSEPEAPHAQAAPRWSVAHRTALAALAGGYAMGAAQAAAHVALLAAQRGVSWRDAAALLRPAWGAVLALASAGYAAQAAETWAITVAVTSAREAFGRTILERVAGGDFESPIAPPPDADARPLHAALDRMRAALGRLTRELLEADLRLRALFASLADELAPRARALKAAADTLAAAPPDADSEGPLAALDVETRAIEGVVASVRDHAGVDGDASATAAEDAPMPPPAPPLEARLPLGLKTAAAALVSMALIAAAQALLVRALVPAVGEALGDGRWRAHAALAAGAYAVDAACVAAVTHAMTARRVRLMTGMLARIADGSLAGPVPAALDTDFVRLHEAVGRMQSRLDDAVGALRRVRDARRQMVADLAHELATPASTLLALADALSTRPRSPRHVELLAAEVARLARLVGDLAELAALEAPRFTIARADADLGALARAAAARAELLGGARFEVIVEGEVRARVDAHRVEQVLLNLLHNARRHAAGLVRVAVGAATGGARVTVDDDGPGVDDALLPRLGERMFRADPSRSARSGGSGLGLSIAARIVALHGGAMRFARSPLGGLRVEVTLPDAAPPPADLREKTHPVRT